MKKIALLMASIMLTSVLSGCFGKNSQELAQEKSGKIKVFYEYGEDRFLQTYGNLFLAQYPNMEIEVIAPDQETFANLTEEKEIIDAFIKLIKSKKVDVIASDILSYEELCKQGIYANLESYVKKDNFDIAQMNPGIINWLKDKGSGNLFGLSPTFQSEALFYNEDLFKKHGVPLPKDGITWQEMFELAGRFPKDGTAKTRVFGFQLQNNKNPISLLIDLAASQGVMLTVENEKKTNFTGEAWKNIFNQVIPHLKSDAIYPNMLKPEMIQEIEMEDPDLFGSGRSAMTIGSVAQLITLQDAKEKGQLKFNWNVVTPPVSKDKPDSTSNFLPTTIYSISQDSVQPDLAWELVKYINGESVAKVYSRSLQKGFPTRTKLIKEKDGHNLEGFYKLKPNLQSISQFVKLPPMFLSTFGPTLNQAMKDLLEGKKEMNAVLQELQEKSQKQLDESHDALNKEKQKNAEKKAKTPENK